jgi:hypothetical protein
MKFMITFPLSSESYKERTARFLETGGGPPEGVTMHGRWHSVSGSCGWVLASSDDPSAIYTWVAQWADLIDFEVDIVIDDEEAAAVLQKLG